jgi:hypothetical protein
MIPQNFVKKQINIAHPTHTPNSDMFALEVNGSQSTESQSKKNVVKYSMVKVGDVK